MKQAFALALLFLTISAGFSWNYYSGNNNNHYSASVSGRGELSERFSKNMQNPITNPLITGNKIITATNQIIILNSEGETEWEYNQKDIILSPIIHNNNLILFTTDSVESYTLNSEYLWTINLSSSINQNPIISGEVLLLIFNNEVRAYNASSSEYLWASDLSSCTKSAVIQEDFLLSCGNKLNIISLTNGSTLASKNNNNALASQLLVHEDLIIFASTNSILVFDKELNMIDRLRLIDRSKSVSTNIALGDDLYVCAENGLYSISFDGELYIKKFMPEYKNCRSIITLDYNSNGFKELIIQQGSDMIIINKTGGELARKPFSAGFFSASDTDSDGLAELITFSTNGELRVYDTSSPDNNVELSLTEKGLLVNITNTGFKNSKNATLRIRLEGEEVVEQTSINKMSSAIKSYKLNTLSESFNTIIVEVNDPADTNTVNNNASLTFEAFNITGNNYLEIIHNNQYYDFNKEFKSLIIEADVNNDGFKEQVISTISGAYTHFRESDNFFELGDLTLNINHFHDEIFENETLNIFGAVENNAVYLIKGVTLDLLIDSYIIESRSFDMPANSNQSFEFNVTGFKPGKGFVSVAVDLNNKIIERDESNNAKGKAINVVELPIHELSIIIDTTTTIKNNILKIRITNTGGYDEELLISSDSNLFTDFKARINKGTVREYPIVLDLKEDIYSFNLIVSNENYLFSEIIGLDLRCVFDCEDKTLHAPVVEQISREKGATVSASRRNDERASVFTGFIAGFEDFVFKESILYWPIIIILLAIASYALYAASFKWFENHAHIIAFSNIIIFLLIAYLFKPGNIHLILIEQIILSLGVFSISRRA